MQGRWRFLQGPPYCPSFSSNSFAQRYGLNRLALLLPASQDPFLHQPEDSALLSFLAFFEPANSLLFRRPNIGLLGNSSCPCRIRFAKCALILLHFFNVVFRINVGYDKSAGLRFLYMELASYNNCHLIAYLG